MAKEITDDKIKKGIIFTFVCIILVLGVIAVVNFVKFGDNSGPDGTEWAEGVIISVTTTNERYSSEKNVVVYDCEVIIRYDVAGQMYERNLRLTDSSSPIFVGDTYYVCVYENDPTNVYDISTSKGNNSRNFNLIGDLVPIFMFGLVFILFLKSGALSGKSKKASSYGTYNEAARSAYYNDTYNNSSYNNDTYYNSSSYDGKINNYDEYNNTRGSVSDYSGTSLKD